MRAWVAILALVSPATSLAAEEPPAPTPVPTATTAEDLETRVAEAEEALDELETRLREVRAEARAASPGTTAGLLTGYVFGAFSAPARRAPSTFQAGFRPVLVWKAADDLLVEGEIELELEEEIEVELEYAHAAWVAHDLVTVGVGKFLAPLGLTPERLHPEWIQKLPELPMAFGHDGLVPTSVVGAQVRGGLPLGPSKLGYALFVANGPTLNTGDDEAEEAGMLHFDNFVDENRDKAVGGRIGFLPLPWVELGISAQSARVRAEGTSRDEIGTLLGAADATISRDTAAGSVDLRLEWIRLEVEEATYDPDGSLGFGPVSFENERSGGYAQIAWRASKLPVQALRGIEVVGRYDLLDLPADAPMAADRSRLTVGVNWWLTSNAVAKAAWRDESVDDPMGMAEAKDAFLAQFSIGL